MGVPGDVGGLVGNFSPGVHVLQSFVVPRCILRSLSHYSFGTGNEPAAPGRWRNGFCLA